MIEEKRERLAVYAHNAWAEWMRYVLSKLVFDDEGDLTIRKKTLYKWASRAHTPYKNLPKKVKKAYREQADKIIEIMRSDDND